MIRELVCVLLRLTLIPTFIREVIQRKRVTIILYHDINPNLAEKHFKVLKNKYNIIALKDYIEARKSGKVKQLPPKSLVITFDDGFKINYRLKPIIEKYKIPITIFLCSGIVGTKRHFWFEHSIKNNNLERCKNLPDAERLEYLKKFGFEETKDFKNRMSLSEKEIRDMKNIVDFQSHTIFHPTLPKCFTNRVRKEILHSKKQLESDYGFKIYALSYPNGDYSDREISIAKNAGYECGITLDLGFNSQNTNLFRLKRICISDRADVNELLVTVSGLWELIKRVLNT